MELHALKSDKVILEWIQNFGFDFIYFRII